MFFSCIYKYFNEKRMSFKKRAYEAYKIHTENVFERITDNIKNSIYPGKPSLDRPAKGEIL